jgi:DNA polymerase-3 subunit gamma/tau
MTESLASKYRPRYFQDMVGQNMIAVVLHRMVTTGQVPEALLFSGTRGTGKTTAARILAAALNCTGLPESAIQAGLDENTPCGYCDSCLAVRAGTSLDVVEIDAASKGSVEDIRNLIEMLRFQMTGSIRVVILDEAHSMSREAFNALLKTLEEPPAGTVFVLVTTEPERLPDTVLSRLIEFSFRRVSPADIFTRISNVASLEEIEIESALIEKIAERSDGSMRDALMALDLVHRANVTTVAEYIELVGEVDLSTGLLLAATTGDANLIYTELDRIMLTNGDPGLIVSQLTRILRDLLVMRAGGTLTYVGTAMEKRIELNQKLEPERILGGLKILWDLKTKVRVSDDPRGSLDLAIMLLAEVFTRGKTVLAQKKPAPVVEAPTSVETPAPKKLSLADMQARVKEKTA